jgi:hypothetical protein
MLNPSTADAVQDDPTIRLCIQWGRTPGFEGVGIVNLFAWRATSPRDLVRRFRTGTDVAGPENNDAIIGTASASDMVICAWGNRGKLGGQAERVRSILLRNGVSHHALKMSKEGQPVHPLYQPYSLVPVKML